MSSRMLQPNINNLVSSQQWDVCCYESMLTSELLPFISFGNTKCSSNHNSRQLNHYHRNLKYCFQVYYILLVFILFYWRRQASGMMCMRWEVKWVRGILVKIEGHLFLFLKMYHQLMVLMTIGNCWIIEGAGKTHVFTPLPY